MRVIAEIHYAQTVELEIPDGLSEEDARAAACAALDTAERGDMEWCMTIFTRNGEDNEWFDVG